MHSLSKSIWSDLGFITVFTLPYQIENIIYSLSPGQESNPYQTKTGFYIFKNIEERKAVGRMKVAQILIAIPSGTNEEYNSNAKRVADSIYAVAQAGGDFSELAKTFSNDKLTYMNGGIMPELGVGKYDPEFENKVFAIQKDGDISFPFKTQYGYHIVKRISHSAVSQDKNDATYLYNLKQQVQLDSRITIAKEKFLNEVLKKLNYKKNASINETDLWKITDSFVIAKKFPVKNLTEKSILFSIANKNVTVGDWLKFAKEYKASTLYKGETEKELYKIFISSTALDNYRKKLPEFNPEFKYQMQEFKDGNMLFEVMERNVWTKASSDSLELKKYYLGHKNKYLWNASADAVLVSCANEKVAADAVAQIKNGKSWRQLTEANPSQIQTDSSRYELTQIAVKQPSNLYAGLVTEPMINTADGTASFAKIFTMYPAHQQRNFEESRGLVINDYQNFLEEKWVEQLKKKYPVKVNEAVFQSLLK